MFIGHFGVGFGAKTTARKVSLGTLFMASQFLDLLWPSLLLLGQEHASIDPEVSGLTPLRFDSYPISHSLLMVCVWGFLFGFAYWLVRKDYRSAVVLGICVVSHWMLDLIVHRPDLPLYPGHSPLVGLGLWNSVGLTLVVEGLVFIAGITLYLRSTEARNRTGNWSLWVLIAFLLVIHMGNLFGPPPTSMKAIAWVGQSQWLLVAWGYWVDRNRSSR